ncbi:hypothetical protein [Mycobacterium sp. 1274761.0]|nr:hypothetical protein [Mycobacterium sp. 1274761.0]
MARRAIHVNIVSPPVNHVCDIAGSAVADFCRRAAVGAQTTLAQNSAQ